MDLELLTKLYVSAQVALPDWARGTAGSRCS